MLLGVIADDFTGASDIANTLAKGVSGEGGLATVQLLGVPPAGRVIETEAGVVALKSRSVPAKDAVAQSLAALDWLRAQGCRQIVFKYCSTFDSTPAGNIGPVAEALARALGVGGVIVCPASPTLGRTVYQGHLFVGDRLLSQSGMEDHPLNPMTDPDLRRWLALQTEAPVGLVPLAVVERGAGEIRQALDAAAREGRRLVVVDAVRDADLLAIGEAAAGAALVTGGSGIALGLPRSFIRAGLAQGGLPVLQGVSGPEAILAGSCSRATRAQVAHHRLGHPSLAVDVAALMAGAVDSVDLARFATANQGRAPLIYSSQDPEEVGALQDRFGRERVALRLDRLFADTARDLVRAGVRRLVVAGGETSGAVASALALEALTIGPEIEPGVPVLTTGGDRPLALALKSGNFGSESFFAKALRRLGGEAT